MKSQILLYLVAAVLQLQFSPAKIGALAIPIEVAKHEPAQSDSGVDRRHLAPSGNQSSNLTKPWWNEDRVDKPSNLTKSWGKNAYGDEKHKDKSSDLTKPWWKNGYGGENHKDKSSDLTKSWWKNVYGDENHKDKSSDRTKAWWKTVYGGENHDDKKTKHSLQGRDEGLGQDDPTLRASEPSGVPSSRTRFFGSSSPFSLSQG